MNWNHAERIGPVCFQAVNRFPKSEVEMKLQRVQTKGCVDRPITTTSCPSGKGRLTAQPPRSARCKEFVSNLASRDVFNTHRAHLFDEAISNLPTRMATLHATSACSPNRTSRASSRMGALFRISCKISFCQGYDSEASCQWSRAFLTSLSTISWSWFNWKSADNQRTAAPSSHCSSS